MTNPAVTSVERPALPRRISPATLTVGLVPSLVIAWVLWLAPIGDLHADRAAMALRDYTALWSAGQLAAAHDFAALADPARFTAAIRELFGPGMPGQIWPYPPNVLLLARVVASLPLVPGFVLYSVAGLLALALSLRAGRLPPRLAATVLLSPAIAANLLAGQNGALVAAFACGGLLLLDRRPVIAGLLLGFLSLKPQFAILLPLCFVAGRQWRALIATGASAALIALLSAGVFGIEPWRQFLAGNPAAVADHVSTDWRADSAQSIFSSAFMAARSIGASLPIAYLCQVVATAVAAVLACWLWSDRQTCPRRLMVATLPLLLVAAPWVHNYDMPALAVAVVLLMGDVKGWRRALLTLAWLWPGLAPLIPVPPIVSFLSVASVAFLACSVARSRAPGAEAGPAYSPLLSSA